MSLLITTGHLDPLDDSVFLVDFYADRVHLSNASLPHVFTGSPESFGFIHSLQGRWAFCELCFYPPDLPPVWQLAVNSVEAEKYALALQVLLDSWPRQLLGPLGQSQILLKSSALLPVSSDEFPPELLQEATQRHTNLHSLVQQGLNDARLAVALERLFLRLPAVVKDLWNAPEFTQLVSSLGLTKLQVEERLCEGTSSTLDVWVRLPVDTTHTQLAAFAQWPKNPLAFIHGRQFLMLKVPLGVFLYYASPATSAVFALDDNCTQSELDTLVKLPQLLPGAVQALRAAGL